VIFEFDWFWISIAYEVVIEEPELMGGPMTCMPVAKFEDFPGLIPTATFRA
jgi:hypothetical protein